MPDLTVTHTVRQKPPREPHCFYVKGNNSVDIYIFVEARDVNVVKYILTAVLRIHYGEGHTASFARYSQS